MKNTVSAIIALVLLVAIAGGCFSNSSSTTVKGVVWDYDKPVAGAEVSFGPTGGQEKVVTGPDGKFTITAKHRPTAMLRLNVKKDGLTQREAVEFPGFAAPTDEIKVEMLAVIGSTR